MSVSSQGTFDMKATIRAVTGGREKWEESRLTLTSFTIRKVCRVSSARGRIEDIGQMGTGLLLSLHCARLFLESRRAGGAKGSKRYSRLSRRAGLQ
jgi:hypothetical protein